MRDDKVAEDLARQSTSHEAVKASVDSHVNAEIRGEAAAAAASGVGQARVAEVATHLREKSINETVQGERMVDHARTAARGSQFIDYAFYVLYALLGLRLVLALISARSGNGFVQFIHTVTNPFYAPFRGIVGSPTAEGGYTLAVPIVIAIVVYMLLHAAINGLLRMVASRKTAI